MAGASSMSKTRSDGSSTADAARPGPPPLNAGIRRHLGISLRSLYAEILSEPPSSRIEAVLARLGTPKR
jgi:hypothetical protein